MRRPSSSPPGRRPGRMLVAAALLVCPSGATGQVYDMGPMLDEPHPFEVAPQPQLRPPSRPSFSGRLYDMGPMLDEPHPFDVPPAPPTQPVSPSEPGHQGYPPDPRFRGR